MTDLIACGYGTPDGCLVCDDYGNDSKEPVMIADMPEPGQGTVVIVAADTSEPGPDGPPAEAVLQDEQLEQAIFVRSNDEDATVRWWDPLNWGATSWGVILHEATPHAPKVVSDPVMETVVVDLAIYKQRYSGLLCENCHQQMGPKRTFTQAP